MIFKDFFTIVSLLSPYLIPLYLLMSSFFNQDMKGLIYLILLTVNVYTTFMMSKFINIESGLNSDSNFCNFGPFNGLLTTMGNSNNNALSINSSIIGFTLSYLGYPMYLNNNVNLIAWNTINQEQDSFVCLDPSSTELPNYHAYEY